MSVSNDEGNYIPLLERCELLRSDDADVPRVWYRVTAPKDASLLEEMKAGDWVMILARVNSLRTSGGYRTGAPPPGSAEKLPVEERPVEPGLEFRLEQSEIYFVLTRVLETPSSWWRRVFGPES